MSKLDVSIIIVNYHSADLVVDCINSVLEKTSGLTFEIIVIDNASGDDSVDKLRIVFDKRIQIIESDVNLGFGKANNLGCQFANGEYVFLLNPDTVLVNNAIKILHDVMIDHPNYGVVGGNLYMPNMSPAPSHCLFFDDIETEKKSASWSKLLLGKLRSKLKVNEKKPFADNFNWSCEPIEVAYIFGADMMMKKSLYDAVGGFDADFFMYGEEEELTWRVAKEGYKVVNVPRAQIIHLEGATTKKENEFSERQFRMRMNGMLTYFFKRYGQIGVHSFFELRTRRYKRLMKIAAVQGKLTADFPPVIQLHCLEEVYKEYIQKIRG